MVKMYRELEIVIRLRMEELGIKEILDTGRDSRL